MEATLVLRAASCWGAWATAMAILKNLNIEDATAAEWLEKAYWLITRVPEPLYRELTQSILDRGLCGGTVRLWAADWHCGDSLVMLRWQPPNGWVHLLSETGRRERRGAIHN